MLREQLLNAEGVGVMIPVRFFNVEDGLSSDIRKMLNDRIKEVKLLSEQQLAKRNEEIVRLRDKVKKYELLTPKDYPLVNLDVIQLFRNVKMIHREELITKGIEQSFGINYLETITQHKMQVETAELNEYNTKKEINILRIELVKLVKDEIIELRLRIKELEEQIMNMQLNTQRVI